MSWICCRLENLDPKVFLAGSKMVSAFAISRFTFRIWILLEKLESRCSLFLGTIFLVESFCLRIGMNRNGCFLHPRRRIVNSESLLTKWLSTSDCPNETKYLGTLAVGITCNLKKKQCVSLLSLEFLNGFVVGFCPLVKNPTPKEVF